MPVSPDQTGKKRYIVRMLRDPRPLVAFIDAAEHDPDMELLDVIGPAGLPHTAVLALSEDKARMLDAQFRQGGELSIEPDRPLSLF